MLFSSGCFVFLFLPISLIGYELTSRVGGKALLAWLALISLCFYEFWSRSIFSYCPLRYCATSSPRYR